MNAFRIWSILPVLGALIGFLLPGRVLAAAPSQEEVAEAAAWFDHLDWTELAGKPYVEIVLGKEHRMDQFVDGPAVRGFLIAEDVKGYTLFVDGIDSQDRPTRYRGWPFALQRIEKSWPKAPPELVVTSRVIELPVAVDEAIAAARQPGKADKSRNDSPPPIVSKRVALFGLARWCAQVGRPDLAVRLDTELLTLNEDSPHPAGAAQAPFRAVVENEVAHALMWKALADWGEVGVSPGMESVPRSGLQAEFARIVRDFPASADRPEADRLAETLRQMIVEDDAHVRPGYEQMEKMSREEQVREWIFELRDQQYFPSYMTDMPAVQPVEELVRLGYAAVPELLKTLDDQRLTRSVVRAGGRFPGPILTFADGALDALAQIAGRNFGFTPAALPSGGDHDRAKARRVIEAWWKAVGNQGERAFLIKAVRAGGPDAGEKATRLAEVDPGVLVASLSARLEASKSEEVREQLLQQLRGIKGDATATAALRRELRMGKDLRSRVASAKKLFAGGATDVVPLMVREFGKPLPKRHYDAELWADDAGPLIEFLGSCGDLPAMQALAARLPLVTPDFRALIVDAAIPKEPRKPLPAAVEALGEKIAVSALDDRSLAFEPWPPGAGNSGGVSPEAGGPRVCDVAAAALARRWPDRYPFVDSPAKLERDAQLAIFRNTWRTAQGLKALPVPERPRHPAARNNANVIAEFRWIGGGPVAGFPGKLRQPRDSSYPFPVEAQFALQVGRPLTGKAFMTAVEQLQRMLADDCLGIAVSAERLGDRRGMVVEIERLGRRTKGKHATLEMVPKRDLSLHAVVNGKPVAHWDEGGFDGGAAFFHDEQYATGIDDALKADPGAILEVYFQSMEGQ